MRPYRQAYRAVGVFAVLVVVWAAAAAAAVAPAAPPAAPSSPALDAAQQALAAELAKLGQPGPFHEYLKAFAGTWKTTTTLTVDPRLPPTVTTGHAVKRMILGGRFLQEEAQGEAQGQPFASLHLTGYDNFRKQYVAVRMDDRTTSLLIARGVGDEGGRSFSLEGEYDDLRTGRKVHPRIVLHIEGPDKHVLAWYAAGPDGVEAKLVEVVFERE